MEQNGIASAIAAAPPQPHVLLLPLPAQGHINPMVCIARFLAEHDVCVTLAVAARAHASLMAAASGDNDDDATLLGGACRNIRVEVLPDGLPSDPKEHVPLEKMGASMSILQRGAHDLLHRLLQSHEQLPRIASQQTWDPPCCIIIDSILTWGYDLARLFSLPQIALWTSAASSLSIGIHIPDLVSRGYLPANNPESRDRRIDFVPGLTSLRIADIPELFTTQEGLESPPFQFLRIAFEQANGAARVLVNSMHELEKEVIDALKEEQGVEAVAVGPLFLTGGSRRSRLSMLEEDRSCVAWLDEQWKEGAAVLYISFGSVSSIERKVFEELAEGLEASGERFLWVMRPGEHVKDGKVEAVEAVLPEGFRQRTAGRGLMVAWAPQLEVLAHPSVAVFLSHCGWNSVLESLSNGVPILGFPQQADQRTNLKHIVQDWKVGLPLVPFGQQVLHRSHVQASVSAIMSCHEAREHALEWKAAAQKAAGPGGSSNSNLQNLAHDIKAGCFKRAIKQLSL